MKINIAFRYIVEELTAGRGVKILWDTNFAALLAERTKGEFPNETALLLHAITGRFHTALDDLREKAKEERKPIEELINDISILKNMIDTLSRQYALAPRDARNIIFLLRSVIYPNEAEDTDCKIYTEFEIPPLEHYCKNKKLHDILISKTPEKAIGFHALGSGKFERFARYSYSTAANFRSEYESSRARLINHVDVYKAGAIIVRSFSGPSRAFVVENSNCPITEKSITKITRQDFNDFLHDLSAVTI